MVAQTNLNILLSMFFIINPLSTDLGAPILGGDDLSLPGGNFGLLAAAFGGSTIMSWRRVVTDAALVRVGVSSTG